MNYLNNSSSKGHLIKILYKRENIESITNISTDSNISDMANKIEMLSPKKEIIDHFDSLINRVDIDIDECLEKYNQEQVLSELDCFDVIKRKVRGQNNIHLNGISDKYIQYETVDEWSESTKVVDYLNRIRMRKIEELRKAQVKTLEYY